MKSLGFSGLDVPSCKVVKTSSPEGTTPKSDGQRPSGKKADSSVGQSPSN
jgi:hypothetical protein